MLTPTIDTNDPITAQLLRALEYKKKYCVIEGMFPDKGKHKRSLYKKHMMHFAAGATYRQRLFMCANQVGKTTAAGIELTYHLTGIYPQWWKGKRFAHPQIWWVCGKYTGTVKDILQTKLLGPVGDFGSGLIPKNLLDMDTMTAAKKADTGITDFRVKHITGGYSQVGFRSYDQGRKAFEGTKRSIWMDEEPPLDIFQECLMRTVNPTDHDEDNIIMMTFTPLDGLSDTVKNFIGAQDDQEYNYEDGEKGLGKWLTGADWDDVPHLSASNKAELRASYHEYQLDARTKGIPQLGAGAVYPVPVNRVFIEPIPIPEHWKRCFALDFGFKDPTAILWAAVDPETDVTYVYAESYLREQPPMVHSAILDSHNKRAGYIIPGVCDPSGGGSSTNDGKNTRELYRTEYNVIMHTAINSIEPGITTVLNALVTDKLKIFNTCLSTKKEFTAFQRNDKGKPIGADHCMDDLRYLMMSGIKIAKTKAEVLAELTRYDKEYEPSDIYGHKDWWLYV